MTARLGTAPGHVPGAFSSMGPGEAVSELWRFIENPGTRFGTGWSVDEQCGQVGKGELALCIARSSSGKSTWFLNIIANTPHVPTLVVNMEMTPRMQVQWLAPMTFDMNVAARDMEDVMRAGPEDRNWQEVRNKLAELDEAYPNLHFVMPSRPQVADIGIIINDIEDATGVRPVRVFVDHMKYLAGSERGYDGYTQNTAAAKELAMSEDVAMYLLQQTGRRGGEGEANDGHLPVKFGSGLYGGEEDADWMYGLYRPERDPRLRRSEHQFDNYGDYLDMLTKREAIKDQVKFQVIKNRPFSELEEDGVTLYYNQFNRRLREQ